MCVFSFTRSLVSQTVHLFEPLENFSNHSFTYPTVQYKGTVTHPFSHTVSAPFLSKHRICIKSKLVSLYLIFAGTPHFCHGLCFCSIRNRCRWIHHFSIQNPLHTQTYYPVLTLIIIFIAFNLFTLPSPYFHKFSGSSSTGALQLC